MELTREQRAAAEACGCALIPATEEQVRRLTMQRRVFRLDGEPVLATRDGGCFETHGTLAALIGEHAAVSIGSGAALDRPRLPGHAAASDADPAAASGPEPSQAAIRSIGPATPDADLNPVPEPCAPEPPAGAAEPGAQGDGAAVSATDAEAEVAAPAAETGVEGEPSPLDIGRSGRPDGAGRGSRRRPVGSPPGRSGAAG